MTLSELHEFMYMSSLSLVLHPTPAHRIDYQGFLFLANEVPKDLPKEKKKEKKKETPLQGH